MAWTSADLAALESSIKDGVLSVQYKDRNIRYRDLTEMLQIRDMMQRELGVRTNAGNRHYASFSKGLTPGG